MKYKIKIVRRVFKADIDIEFEGNLKEFKEFLKQEILL